ncbi:hypothetical protein pipiens_020477, partial [Culex pipiens pipiens]
MLKRGEFRWRFS